jgi:hypothetical protein
MKIVSIFAENLFAFHFDDEEENEFARLLGENGIWMNPISLFQFVEEHKEDVPKYENIDELPEKLIESAHDINDILKQITHGNTATISGFFKPLHNQAYRQAILVSQKGRKTYLRLYALKIDDNCFAITGGTIKFTHLLKDKPHTQTELQKLEKCKAFLKEQDVFDSDSFYELLMEDND